MHWRVNPNKKKDFFFDAIENSKEKNVYTERALNAGLPFKIVQIL